MILLKFGRPFALGAVLVLASPRPRWRAGPLKAPAIDGRHLGLSWILPLRRHPALHRDRCRSPRRVSGTHHFGKVSAGWAALVIVPFAALYGVPTALYEITHLLLLDYIPFIVLLTALFTVTGGIQYPRQPLWLAIDEHLHCWPSARCWPVGWVRPGRQCC